MSRRGSTVPPEGPRDDARALVLLREHAYTATAFQVLAPGMRHWFDCGAAAAPSSAGSERASNARGNDAVIGMVAYVEVGSAWVVAGEPVAARADTIGVAERFVEYAALHGRRASFFATEGALTVSTRFRRVFIGEQPVWNPMEWPDVVKGNRSLREQLRRARAKGVRVRALDAAETGDGSTMRAALNQLTRRWLATRPMSSMHFLVELEPFEHVEARRLFVAERAEGEHGYQPVAFLSLAPVFARNGWFLEHLLRDPGAPNGTSEALVDFVMRALAADNVTWATLGLAPLAGPVSGWLRLARSAARPFYNFAGLSAFKRKLKPSRWEPIYLAYPRERSSVWAMCDGLRAFAGGSMAVFALRTILRGPPPLLRALEYSLVPWTIALALWPAQPWFPSPLVKWSWVVFDVLLLGALYQLRGRWTDRRAARIAAVVTLDTILTFVQAGLWNVSRTRSALEAAMVVIACSGPALAAAVLWGAVRRRAILSESPR
jgi:phosphatidylglycerol lysyltransferase